MKILNDDLLNAIKKGVEIKLDLGCGISPRKGFYSVDYLDIDGIDIQADLNEPLDLIPSFSIDYIYSRHVLEHIDKFIPLMREIHRIAKKGATIELIVPHFSNVYGFSDPTHVRVFGLYSMSYFVSLENQPEVRKVPEFYTDTRFIVNSVEIDFYRNLSNLDMFFGALAYKLVNINMKTQNFYERRLTNFFHAWQIRWLMEPVK